MSKVKTITATLDESEYIVRLHQSAGCTVYTEEPQEEGEIMRMRLERNSYGPSAVYNDIDVLLRIVREL